MVAMNNETIALKAQQIVHALTALEQMGVSGIDVDMLSEDETDQIRAIFDALRSTDASDNPDPVVSSFFAAAITAQGETNNYETGRVSGLQEAAKIAAAYWHSDPAWNSERIAAAIEERASATPVRPVDSPSDWWRYMRGLSPRSPTPDPGGSALTVQGETAPAPVDVETFRREVRDKLSVAFYNGQSMRGKKYGGNVVAQCEEFLVEMYRVAASPVPAAEGLTETQRHNFAQAREFIAMQGARAWRPHALAARDAVLAAAASSTPVAAEGLDVETLAQPRRNQGANRRNDYCA